MYVLLFVLSCVLLPPIAGHLKEGDVVDTVAEYQAPAPPAGNHRYIFTVYEQVRAAQRMGVVLTWLDTVDMLLLMKKMMKGVAL